MGQSKNDKYIKFRHKVAFALLRPLMGLGLRPLYNFKEKRFPLKKGDQYLILSNHQSTMDPVLVCLSFHTPIYIVATDTLFKNKFWSKVLTYIVAPIPKRKAATDVACIKTMKKVASEGGSLMIFPEGNRAWADYQFAISPAISKMVKMMDIPLALYNIHGGYGVNPRWGHKLRRGKMTGEVVKVLSREEIKSLSNDDLYDIIVQNLRVIDSDSKAIFESKKRAEYLERELFICPCCKKWNTISSNGNFVSCSCGAKAEYTKDLQLESENHTIPFTKLVDWYRYQQKVVKEYDFVDEIIFEDCPVKLYDQSGKTKKLKLAEGKITLTREVLRVENFTIPVKEIVSKSVIGGCKLLLGTKDTSYFIVGHERFNPIKYALVLNRLETACEEDIYYGLDI